VKLKKTRTEKPENEKRHGDFASCEREAKMKQERVQYVGAGRGPRTAENV
jgi:hypothetical protein